MVRGEPIMTDCLGRVVGSVLDFRSMAKELTDIEPLLPLLQRRPLGVMSDVDGTLSPLVARPEEARVPESTREVLRELMGKGVRVAAITGRSLAVARAMVGVEGVAYAADHGMTLWIEGRRESAPGLAEYEALARAAEGELAGLSNVGVQIENKGALLGLHYRNADEPERAREAILARIGRSEAAGRFEVREGRMVVELRPRLVGDKGTALEALAERLGLAAIVCLGDDVTDIDMFRAARGLAAVEASSVAVASGEASAGVVEAADYALAGEGGVEWLLRELVRALP
jgi:trehalose 6-phosphate phosphatase